MLKIFRRPTVLDRANAYADEQLRTRGTGLRLNVRAEFPLMDPAILELHVRDALISEYCRSL